MEHDNLRAARRWCLASPSGADAGLRFGRALCRFWVVRGYLTEGRGWLTEVLSREDAAAPTKARADALHAAWVLTAAQGDPAAACVLAEEQLEIRRLLGDQLGVARCLVQMGDIVYWGGAGDSGRARSLVAEAVTLWHSLGSPVSDLGFLASLGELLSELGEFDTAQEVCDGAVAEARASGGRHAVGFALANSGELAWRRRDFGAAQALFEASLTIAREFGDPGIIGGLLRKLGLLASLKEDHLSARILYGEGLSAVREVGNRAGISQSLSELGNEAAREGDWEAARAHFEESLAIGREIGNSQWVAVVLAYLSDTAMGQGDLAAAHRFLDEGLAIRQEFGNKMDIAYALTDQGNLALQEGDLEAAQALYQRSLRTWRELSHDRGVAFTVAGLARVASAFGKIEYAAHLAGAVDALCESVVTLLPPSVRPSYDHHVATVRAALGDGPFSVAWTQGHAMSREQCVDYALEGAEDA